MASIIDKINEAETKAASMRADAQQKGKEALLRAAEKSAKTLSETKVKLRQQQIEAVSGAEEKGARLAEQLLSESNKQADEISLAAKKNIDAAVKYIIESVTAQ